MPLRKAFSYLFFSSLITISLLTLSSVANLLFVKVSALYLNRSAFGTLSCLVNMMMIIIIPFSAFQSFIAQQIASFDAASKPQNAFCLFNIGLKMSVMVALPLAGLLFIFNDYLTQLFHVSSDNVFMLAGVIIVFLLPFQIFLGFFQGIKSFASYCLPVFMESCLRVALGYSMLRAGFGITGVLFSFVGSYIGALGLCCGLIKNKFTNSSLNYSICNLDPTVLRKNFVKILLSFSVYGILVFSDILLVKHFFTPEQAGDYAAAANIGRFFFFIPTPLITVMYPKIVELHHTESRREMRFVLLNITFAVALACFAFITVCYFYAPLVIQYFLDASKYLHTVYLIRYMSVIMSFFVLINVLLYYNIARNRRAYFVLIICGTALQILLICRYHDCLRTVMQVLQWTSASIFLLFAMLTIYEDRSGR